MGQRNDIMVVLGQKEAMAIRNRLVLCDGVMDTQATPGTGAPLDPADQWSAQPGEIPERA